MKKTIAFLLVLFTITVATSSYAAGTTDSTKAAPAKVEETHPLNIYASPFIETGVYNAVAVNDILLVGVIWSTDYIGTGTSLYINSFMIGIRKETFQKSGMTFGFNVGLNYTFQIASF